MIEVYKLFQEKYDSDVSNIVKLHKDNDTKEGTKGHSLKLEKKASHLDSVRVTPYKMTE